MSHSDITHNLVAAARAGSDYAFGRLVGLHQSRLRAFGRRLTGGDYALADDLAQECFMKARAKISALSSDEKLLSWLFGILYRCFLDHQRKTKRRQEFDDMSELGLVIEDQVVPESSELRLDLERALTGLRIEERSAITLSLAEGLSHPEVAQIMDLPVGTVKSHIARGREKLKNQLSIWQEKRATE
jgi:RNA polymerase sigma-70 factor (ECF subfamily)